MSDHRPTFVCGIGKRSRSLDIRAARPGHDVRAAGSLAYAQAQTPNVVVTTFRLGGDGSASVIVGELGRLSWAN